MSSTATQNDEFIHFSSLARALWFKKLFIGICVAVSVAISAIYITFFSTSVYRANTVVMLDSREASVGGLDSVLGGLAAEQPIVNTEVEVLRGRSLLGRVVDDLMLLENPEFNPYKAQPTLKSRIKDWLWGADASAVDPDFQTRLERDATISVLLNQIDVRAVPASLVFHITATSTSPQTATQIADAIALQYIQDQQNVRFDAAATAAQWLTDQLADLRISLEAAESAVRRFKSSTDLIDAQALAVLDRQLKETRTRREHVEAQIRDNRGQLSQMREAKSPSLIAQISGDPRILSLIRGGGVDPQDLAEYDILIARTQNDLVQNIARLSEQSQSLGLAISSLEGDLETQSQDLIRLEQLTREAESNRLLYEHFQTKLKETSAQMGISQADSRLLSAAVTPTSPAAPRKGLILALGATLGFIVSVLAVVLSETQSQSLRTSADAQYFTGLPMLAQMPKIPVKDRKSVLPYLSENPLSVQSEAIRALRTSVRVSSLDKSPQVIMITSALPAEGKTTTVVSLAQSYHAMGQRVLTIDCDIRRGTIGQYLPIAKRAGLGLIATLRGEKNLQESIFSTPDLGDVLMVEETAVSATDLFQSDVFKNLLVKLRADYDIILVDTPPVLIAPDARIIGQHCDACVMIVRWNGTRRDQLLEALEQFTTANIKITGLAFSQISAQGMQQYRYSAYKYAPLS